MLLLSPQETGNYEDKLQLSNSLIMLVAAIATTLILKKWVDKEPFKSLGFDTTGILKSSGLAIVTTLGTMVLGTAILIQLDSIKINLESFDLHAFTINILLFTSVAFCEEILFRGYILGNLLKKLNRFWALTISSVLFGLLHAFNPNVEILPILNIILAGYLLGSVYIFTKNLWFAIVLHFLWNFTQGPILGYKVSGNLTNSIYSIQSTGSELVNGGSFGFEGSIVCTALCIIATLSIVYYYRSHTKQLQ